MARVLACGRPHGGPLPFAFFDPFDLLRPRRSRRCRRGPRGGVPPESDPLRPKRSKWSLGRVRRPLGRLRPFVITDLFAFFDRFGQAPGPVTIEAGLAADDAGALLGRLLGRPAVALGLHVGGAGGRRGLPALGAQVGDEDLGGGARRLVVLLGEDVVDRERRGAQPLDGGHRLAHPDGPRRLRRVDAVAQDVGLARVVGLDDAQELAVARVVVGVGRWPTRPSAPRPRGHPGTLRRAGAPCGSCPWSSGAWPGWRCPSAPRCPTAAS